MSEQGDVKMEWRLRVAIENMEWGTEGGMVRENVELWKVVAILVLYDVTVLSQCQN